MASASASALVRDLIYLNTGTLKISIQVPGQWTLGSPNQPWDMRQAKKLVRQNAKFWKTLSWDTRDMSRHIILAFRCMFSKYYETLCVFYRIWKNESRARSARENILTFCVALHEATLRQVEPEKHWVSSFLKCFFISRVVLGQKSCVVPWHLYLYL